MIYFDKKHNMYADRSQITEEDIVFTCEDEVWADFCVNPNKYIWVDDEFIVKPNWEEEHAQEELIRIGNLQVTKRVFMLGLEQFGITYSQLKDLLATNERAQMEWDLCMELQRNNPLFDQLAAQFGLSSEILDYIFRKANGEDVEPPEVESGE